jgi:peptidoglycan/LPS O-acetylase OafA/YrhL
MRAFAVLAVFADHLFGWPRAGFVGVDVFFVLSGFFITGILIRERTKSGHISFSNFYIRRVRRIIPSAVLVIVVTVALGFVLLTSTRAHDAMIDGLWASIFLSNWRFESVGTDYFAQGQPDSPLLHYWSLSIEEQFYFVWPLLLLGLFAVTRQYSKRSDRYPPSRQAWLAVFMGTICILSFGWACAQFSSNPTGAYFSTFTRVWELGVGALLAIGVPLLSRIPHGIRPFLSYLGLASAVASLFIISPTMAFPGPWAALPVLSTALVVAAFVGSDVRAVPHLTNPAVTYIGDVSYTMYLWHFPAIILLGAVLPTGLPYFLLVIAVTLALTAVTYHFYEDPIRKSQWLLRASDSVRRRRGLKMSNGRWAAIGTATVIAIVSSIVWLQPREQPLPSLLAGEPAPIDLSAPVDPCFGAPAMVNQGCALRDPDKPLEPSVDDFARDTQVGENDCWRGEGEQIESCTLGYQGDDPAARIALVGDSHAQLLMPVLRPYLVQNKWQLTTYVGFKCQWRFSSSPADCPIDQIQAKLLERPYDLVLTTANRNTTPVPTAAEYEQAWAPVAAVGARIAVLADNPAVSEESLACLTRVGFGDDRTGECATPRSEALAQPDELIAAAALVPGATLIDLTKYYCTEDRCPSVIGNVIVYRDSVGHLTATYARTLAPAIIDGMRRALVTGAP